MILCIIFHVILVFCQIQLTKTQRRIVDGKEVQNEIRYMAYLIKAPVSETVYDAWICGGAIVTDRAIITSAACIEDVKFMYAVAGYKKYVKAKQIRTEECTKHARKRIVLSCVPKSYNFEYENVEKWSNIDIGIVFVESEYDFRLPQPLPGCSWVPDMINVNYFDKFQKPDTDAVVTGFGHKEKWRLKHDTVDYNQPVLQYASVLIISRENCKKSYQKYPNLHDIIDKYMICTQGEGALDSNGTIIPSPLLKEGCSPEDDKCKQRTARSGGGDITGEGVNDMAQDRGNAESVQDLDILRRMGTIRPGICQNDHGGPLVTWIGETAYLLGVASVFLVNPTDKKCSGPYLYTSTACNSKFLRCVIKNITDSIGQKSKLRSILRSSQANFSSLDPNTQKRVDILRSYDAWYEANKEFCELPPEQRGFKMITRRISWDGHPDGPAGGHYREDLIQRPQMSLNVLRTLGSPKIIKKD